MPNTPSEASDTLTVECYVHAKPSEVFSDLTPQVHLNSWAIVNNDEKEFQLWQPKLHVT